MSDDNSNVPPFTIESPTRIRLSPLAVEMARENGMTPKEMAKHLLQQDRLRRAGMVQPEGTN
jgi:hypothetical protein